MKGLIPQAFIDDLLDRVPVAEVVSARIQLKKAGASLKACCPFHQEKTPSFHVNTQKNFYHCFGCGANGNAINFLREYDNLNFNEAVEELAKIAGMEVPRDEAIKREFDAQKPLLEALENARLQYRQALKTHATRDVALSYLDSRGLSEEVIERFGLGYAPAERSFLGHGAPEQSLRALIETRMVSDKYGRPFDLFQNRLMFPIRNARGKTIAFGGRTLGDDKAKYINSPESTVFHKSKEIYGLYEANQANRQLDKLLVVEGYMDVIALAQFGIDYAVATLGTATNEESLNQLLRRCPNLIFCFDGDRAGVQAAKKAMENALPLFQDGMQLNFLLLPEGEDPDSLVRDEGAAAFEARVDQAQPLSGFFFRIYSEGLDLTVPEQRGLLKQRAETQINGVQSPLLRSALRRELNRLTFDRRDFKQKGSEPRNPSQSGVTDKRIVLDPNTAISLALYYQPELAADYLAALPDRSEYESSRQFANFLVEREVKDQFGLYYQLATDMSGYRERFRAMFDKLDWVPSCQQARAAAEDVLGRLERKSQKHEALSAAKSNKRPGQLTEAEIRALKSLTAPATDKPAN